MPVDLEDWSVEKGRYIGTITPHRTLPLDWKIHFVKAGNYALMIIADRSGSNIPLVSPKVLFSVKPKQNLNPGRVLPVALGMPIFLTFLFGLLNYKREKEYLS